MEKLFFIGLISLVVQGCSGSSFNGPSGGQPKSGEKAAPIDAESGGAEANAAVAKTTCWFAVSGGFLGATSKLSPNFFDIISGSTDIIGEAFDGDLGGRFIKPRDEPYVYQDKGGEIDPAVNGTLDSIAVGPGMSIELRNGSGTVVFSGQGPYVALSMSAFPATVSYFKFNQAKMPKWMSEFLSARAFSPPIIKGLAPSMAAAGDKGQGVVSVKVSVIPGGPCGS